MGRAPQASIAQCGVGKFSLLLDACNGDVLVYLSRVMSLLQACV